MNSAAAGYPTWSSGDAYEAYVGRWSALVAPEFVARLRVAPGRRWLDVGCGTGVLTRAILASAAPASVLGIDPSAGFVEHARAAIVDPRATFRLGTAADTGLDDDEVDAVVYGLVLNFVADVGAALAEASRVLAPDGVIAAYVWDYADGMQFIRMFWDAAVALDPAAMAFDQRRTFPIAAPDTLRNAFADAGFDAIDVSAIEIPTTFLDFDDFWTPFTGGTGQAPTYLASLDQPDRDALRESLRSSLPIDPDGQIRMSARAWACRGRASTWRR
jgi:ubiquinone/menaquinone biosynthesis C-methylase UbiE